MKTPAETYVFPPFRLEVGARQLTRDGATLSLTPKAFDTLALLVRRHGDVVRKQEILDSVWRGTFVEDAVLTQNIYTLRRALGDRGATYRLIATVPRIGYRFVAPVRRIESESTGATTQATVSEALRTDPVTSLVVLPLQPLEEDHDIRMLGIGLADALITRLGGIGSLTVRPTSSVLGLDPSHRNAAEAGRALGVEAVLEGRIRILAGKARVNVQLVDTATQTTIWGEQLDEPAEDLFALQDGLADRLADALRLRLSPQEREGLAPGTNSGPAYQAYLQGRYLWTERSAEALTRAISSFGEAVRSDPSWALPRAGLAHCHVLMPFYADVPARASFAEAREQAQAALKIEPKLAEALTVLGYTRFIHDRDWHGAETDLRRALELKPQYATAHHWFAFLLAAQRRFEAAVLHATRAIDLDPLSLVHHADLGWVLYFARQYDDAREQFDSTLNLSSAFGYARIGLSWTLMQLGEATAAVDQARQAMESGSSSVAQATWIHALGRAGETPRARSRLAALESDLPKSRFALALSGIDGAEAEAMDALTQAAAERSRFVAMLSVFPAFDALRDRGDFRQLAEQLPKPIVSN